MSLYDLEFADWQKLLSTEPNFRANQIWDAIHKQAILPEQLTALPKKLREALEADTRLSSALKLKHSSSSDGKMTEKALFELYDNQVIETVLMHYPDRSTVCVSSQAGCAMNCGFCATGQRGFYRQLSVGEIVEQVIWAIQRTRITRGSKRLSNIVFMGMGEPLANTKNLLPAIYRINREIGIGARHITVSTVGIVPGIKKIQTLPMQLNLAVSLHAANDEKRSSMIPINNRYSIDTLMEALDEYVKSTHRRVSFEWAMIDEVNDTDEDAKELVAHCVRLSAHVNLIPLNPTPGWPTKGSPMKRVRAFAQILDNAGIPVSIRDNRGTNIDAACGQLAGTIEIKGNGDRIYSQNSGKIDLSALLN